MGRTKALRRSRTLPIVVAGFVGYVLGGWSASLPRTSALTAAQMVALRFPEGLASTTASTADQPAAIASASATGDLRRAPLSPGPIVTEASAAQMSVLPRSVVQAAVSPTANSPTTDWQASILQASALQASVPAVPPNQSAAPVASPMRMAWADPSADTAAPRPSLPAPTAVAPTAAAATAAAATRAAAARARKLAERPGFILNDAQIASIKERLHLTADQEEMWPAVEAALRNLAYSRAREMRHPGAPATTSQLAAADPNSAEVQGLKSAAIPLIMSFNTEQKDEVRNLAHVMGLDQLANEF